MDEREERREDAPAAVVLMHYVVKKDLSHHKTRGPHKKGCV